MSPPHPLGSLHLKGTPPGGHQSGDHVVQQGDDGNHKFVFYICDSTSELLEKVYYLFAASGLSCSMWDLKSIF